MFSFNMTNLLKLILLLIPYLLHSQASKIGRSDERVSDFALSPNQSHIIIAYRPSIEVYNLETNELAFQTNKFGSEICKILVSPDSSKLYLATKKAVMYYDVENEVINQVLTIDSPVSKMMISPLNHLIIGLENGKLIALNIRDHKELFETSSSHLITSIEFDYYSNAYLIADIKGNIFKVGTTGDISTIYQQKSPCFDLSLQANGRSFMTASPKGTSRFFWNGKDYNFYERENKIESWVTSISDRPNSTAFGFGSGKILIQSTFSKYLYRLNSSIVRVELLDRDMKLQLVAQTLDDEIYFIDGQDMKLIIN